MNIEPPAHERIYYRHNMTGDIGYLVAGTDGKDRIRLDRPNEDPEMAPVFNPDEWSAVPNHRQFTISQIARVAFEADKALSFAMGRHDVARKDWHTLRTEERVRWYSQGPMEPVRAELYKAVMEALRPHAS